MSSLIYRHTHTFSDMLRSSHTCIHTHTHTSSELQLYCGLRTLAEKAPPFFHLNQSEALSSSPVWNKRSDEMTKTAEKIIKQKMRRAERGACEEDARR